MSDLHPDAEPASPGSDRYTATPAPTFGSRAPVDPNDRYTATPAPVRQHFTEPQGSTIPKYKPIANFSRPGAVTSAVTITWIMLALYGFIIGRAFIGAVVGAINPDDAFGIVGLRGPMSNLFLLLAAEVFVFLAWVIAAFVFSIHASAGRQWARIALAVSGGLSLPFQPFCGLPVVVPLVGMMTTVAVIIVLFTPDANDWYRRMS